MSSENVVIGVVPRDRFSMFQQCLEALHAYTDVPFRVVVIAGGADVATRQYLQSLQEQKNNTSVVLKDRLLMQGESRNLAIREAKERFFVILENDTIVHENWLRPLLDCAREEGAAVVAPLILDFWYRGIHAAGCVFEERENDGAVEFHHQIMHQGMKPSSLQLQRMRIDYPENHCILIDRHRLPDNNLFEDVEPFDVDLGLTLRKRGLTIFLEPRSLVTYVPPPALKVCDIAAFKFRWDADEWTARNRRFKQKWNLTYDASDKQIAYRRQHLKLGLARWYPNKFTIWLFNTYLRFLISLKSNVMRLRNEQQTPR